MVTCEVAFTSLLCGHEHWLALPKRKVEEACRGMGRPGDRVEARLLAAGDSKGCNCAAVSSCLWGLPWPMSPEQAAWIQVCLRLAEVCRLGWLRTQDGSMPEMGQSSQAGHFWTGIDRMCFCSP